MKKNTLFLVAALMVLAGCTQTPAGTNLNTTTKVDTTGSMAKRLQNYRATYQFTNNAQLTGAVNNSEGTITVYVMGDKVREDVQITKVTTFTTGTLTSTVVLDRSYFYGVSAGQSTTCYREADTQDDPGCESGSNEHPVDRGFDHEGYLQGTSYLSGTLATNHSNLNTVNARSADGTCAAFTDSSDTLKTSSTREYCFNKEGVFEYFGQDYEQTSFMKSSQRQTLTGVSLGTVQASDFDLN